MAQSDEMKTMNNIQLGKWTIEFGDDDASIVIITNRTNAYYGLQETTYRGFGVKETEADSWNSVELPVDKAITVYPLGTDYIRTDTDVPRLNLKNAEHIGYWKGWDIYRHERGLYHKGDDAITFKSEMKGIIHVYKASNGWVTVAPPTPTKHVSPDWIDIPYFTRGIEIIFIITTPIRTLIGAGFHYDVEELMDQSGRPEGDSLTSGGNPMD